MMKKNLTSNQGHFFIRLALFIVLIVMAATAFAASADDGSNLKMKRNGVILPEIFGDTLNTPPVANADEYTTNMGYILVIPDMGLLGNDYDSDGDPIYVFSFQNPTSYGGTVNVDAMGGFTYTPPKGFYGEDLFTYTISDDKGATDTATVDILIYPVYHNVTFIEGANGTITGSKVQTILYGSSTSAVQAVPNTGYHFANWTGDYCGTDNPLTITNVIHDMTITANFAINTYTISGTVTHNSTGLENVVLSGLPGDPVTNASGDYSAKVDYGWDGIVTPTLAGYAFTPASTSYIDVAENKSDNYTAILLTYTISGTSTSDGNPLATVVMSGLPGDPVTNFSGFYTTTVEYGWDGTVTPSLSGYSFTPINRTYTDVVSDQTGQDYSATLNTYSISGTITLGSNPLADVTISFTDGISPVQTDASGQYLQTVPYGWSGTVTPTKTGYSFTPESIDYTNVIADYTGQNYAATSLASITITSTNGNESWAPGTTHAITWTQSYLSGNVTIDLYKNGVRNRNIGTASASDGTFNWTIALTQALGRDYKIRIFQGAVEDYSDNNFSIARSPADFNRDGISDVLWRLYATGGKNRIWLIAKPAGAASPIEESEPLSEVAEDTEGNNVPEPLAVSDAEMLAGPQVVVRNPLEELEETEDLSIEMETLDEDLEMAEPESLNVTKTLNLPAQTDLDWQMVGTADFNSNGKVDILWRHATNGKNMVWLMNGATRTSIVNLPTLATLQWQIVGTGDFNNDGQPDILWRRSGTGANRVWLMNGATYVSTANLPSLTDLDWKIGGTGDFNRDGKVDIVWRYEKAGGGGKNIVWLMDGTAKLSQKSLPSQSNLKWNMAGVGDFDGDGKPDLIWRYYGSSGKNQVWLMNGCTKKSIETLPAETNLDWKIEN